jgi:mono/diheme cytochrome c family protein
MKSIATRVTLIIALSFITTINVNAQDGAALFKTKCAACHTLGTNKLVGPGLAGINEKRSQEWLIKWIKDAPAFIATGDADAIAVFEEYNKTPMLPFPDMSDADIIAVLDFIKGDGDAVATTAEVEAVPVEEIEYSQADIENGKLLFTGEKRFINGGPSCVTCHNVTNDDLIPGGLLAKDLTKAYERLGDLGIGNMVSAPPYPAMVNSFGNNPLTEEEVMQITGFLKYADKVSSSQTKNDGFLFFAGGGIAGLCFILILISILWSNRKKESTKKDIFFRQLKGNDSIES